jgi:sulfate permease, SulP family
VLIFAAASSLRLGRIDTVLRTGRPSQIAFASTVAATIFLPVTAAVGIGVGLSLLLQVNQEAIDLTVVRIDAARTDGSLRPGHRLRSPAARLRSSRSTEACCSPAPAPYRTAYRPPPGPSSPVVVLRLRGRTTLGATAFIVLADYAERLRSAGGHLFLSGVQPDLLEQLQKSQGVDLRDAVTAVPSSETVLQSTQKAFDDADAWLAVRAA